MASFIIPVAWLEQLVASFYDDRYGWRHDLFVGFLLHFVAAKVLALTPPNQELGEDGVLWNNTSNGVLSTQSAYALLVD